MDASKVSLLLFSLKRYFSDWKSQPLSALLLLLVFAFIITKAFYISFTWDEAASYLYFVQYKTWKPYDTGILDANNHLLNTFFMILEDKYLPKGVFFLRIHSVLSILIFGGAAFSICKGLIKNGSVFLIFAILLLHPYFLDFFSLARGYAMSFAFQMLALALLLSFINKPKWYSPPIIALVCCLATLCNFSLLNFQLALLGITLLFCLIQLYQKIWSVKTFLLAILPGLLLTALFFKKLLPLLFKMKSLGNFYYGGDSGFWENTITSLAASLSYNSSTNNLTELFIKFLALSIFLSVPIWLLVKKERMNQVHWKKLIAVYCILLLMIASTIIQHYYLETLYLIERTALLFLPVFLVITIVLLVNTRAIVLQLLLFVAVSFHFITTVSASSVFEWKMNANNEKAISIFNKIPPPEGRSQINLSTSFEYYSVVKFYCLYYGVKNIAPLHIKLNGIDAYGDYFMFPKKRKNEMKLPPIKEIYYDEVSDFVLAKRLQPYQNKVISTHLMVLNNVVQPYNEQAIKSDAGWSMKPENMFSNGFKIILDTSNVKKNAFIEVDLLMKIDQPLTKEIGISYNVERGTLNLDYKYCELYSILNAQLGQWVHIKYAYPLPQPLKEGDVVSSFLFNNNAQYIAYKQFNISLFYYQNP